MDQHLGKDSKGHYTKEAKGMLINDALGNSKDAEKWTKMGLSVYGLLQGDKGIIKNLTDKKGNINLDLSGLSSQNIDKVKSSLSENGYKNIKFKEK